MPLVPGCILSALTRQTARSVNSRKPEKQTTKTKPTYHCSLKQAGKFKSGTYISDLNATAVHYSNRNGK